MIQWSASQEVTVKRKEDGLGAAKRYEDSDRGKAVRALWRLRNPHRLRDNLIRHRKRMRLMKAVGESLKARFPQFTGAGGPGAGPAGPPPGDGGAPQRCDTDRLSSQKTPVAAVRDSRRRRA